MRGPKFYRIVLVLEIVIHCIAYLQFNYKFPGMFIPDPGFRFLPIPDPGSRIPDPKTATKERGEKKLVVIPFYQGFGSALI